MAPEHAELVIGVVAAVALLLAPLASALIADVGAEISADVDGGGSLSPVREKAQ